MWKVQRVIPKTYNWITILQLASPQNFSVMIPCPVSAKLQAQSQGKVATSTSQPAQSSTCAVYSYSTSCVIFCLDLEVEGRILVTSSGSFGETTCAREFTSTVSSPALLGSLCEKKKSWSSWQPWMHTVNFPTSKSLRLYETGWNYFTSEKLFLGISVFWTKVRM